jgi:hypothetical protein
MNYKNDCYHNKTCFSIFSLILSIFIVLSFFPTISYSASYQQHYSKKSRYKVITKPMLWHEAKRYAESIGGHLVTIRSKKENQYVANLARSKGVKRSFWAGLSDEAKEGRFVWVTGEPLTYTNWHSGEPNNKGNEDYLEIGWHSKYSWNDGPSNYKSNNKQPFVVEFENKKQDSSSLKAGRDTCYKMGILFNDGKGDRRRKGIGGNSFRIRLKELRKYYISDKEGKLVIKKTSGHIKYTSIHIRSTSGTWKLIYKGKSDFIRLKKFKKYWQDSRYNEIVVSINGAHEKFDPIKAKANINVCIRP